MITYKNHYILVLVIIYIILLLRVLVVYGCINSTVLQNNNKYFIVFEFFSIKFKFSTRIFLRDLWWHKNFFFIKFIILLNAKTEFCKMYIIYIIFNYIIYLFVNCNSLFVIVNRNKSIDWLLSASVFKICRYPKNINLNLILIFLGWLF
jgi:hypothetical protein